MGNFPHDLIKTKEDGYNPLSTKKKLVLCYLCYVHVNIKKYNSMKPFFFILL